MQVPLLDKTSCRIRLKDIRSSLSFQRTCKASRQAVSSLKVLCRNQLVLSFASFGTEIDIWQLNHYLLAENRLALPRLSENILSVHRVKSLHQLELHPWGMLQPNSNCPLADLSEIKIALIPGLGFDLKTRARIGYGKGHFDRLLGNLKTVKLCGIGFHEQQVSNLPFDNFDIQMDDIFLF